MINETEKWRVDPYKNGLWRVVAVAPGTPVLVNCGHDREIAQRIVADHAAAQKLGVAVEALRTIQAYGAAFGGDYSDPGKTALAALAALAAIDAQSEVEP